MIKNIIGSKDLAEYLRGKSASFLLALSNTRTSNIKGITQAGIPGKISLTPNLDSEFLTCGEVRSLKGIAKTSKGIPTPALITRACHELKPFSNIELLNLGLENQLKIDYFKIHDFNIKVSDSIATNANIKAEEIFQKALHFAQSYECKDDYIILAECVPSGTTTAAATALALGFDSKEMFSSSFKNVPNDIRNTTIKKALSNLKDSDDIFDKLSKVSDNMLIFLAGFILGLNNKTKLILAGGTQMACVLLIVNSILKQMQGKFKTSNLALCTTKWVFEDEKSDIKSLLDLLDFKISAYYSDFDFSLSSNEALKLYDKGEAKEGVGAGAALAYASLNGISKEIITNKIESFLY